MYESVKIVQSKKISGSITDHVIEIYEYDQHQRTYKDGIDMAFMKSFYKDGSDKASNNAAWNHKVKHGQIEVTVACCHPYQDKR